MPEIFIPLYADDPERKERPEREGQKPVDIEELVSRYDCLAVRGQAGSGKTTLLKHMAYSIISGINPFGMNDCLPVLVFLDDLEKIVRKIPGPVSGAALAERFLEEYFRETGNGLDLQRVKAYSEARRTVFLFDGLDEIEPRHRKSVLSSLIDYANQNPGNKLIFSGRPSGIDADMPLQFADRIADINGLVASQKDAFLEKWFEHISSLREKGKTPQMVMGEIESHEYVRDLTETPLMMTAICILYHYNRKLPEQRAELYERFVNNLIFKRFDDADSVRSYLMRLASEVHRTGDKRFDRAFAVDLLEGIYPRAAEEKDFQYRLRLENKFEEIARKCGLLKVEGNQFIFWHLTFQEFLTARYMVVLGTDYVGAVKGYWTDDRYREVVKLFVGFLNVNNNVALANEVVTSGLGAEEKTPYVRWRLAAEALIDIPASNRSPETLRLAKYRLQEILASERNGKILTEAGESLCWLGDQRNLKEFIPVRDGRYDLSTGKADIRSFEMAKYPVTNSWFEEFIRAEGYKNKDFWSDEGKKCVEYSKMEHPRFWNDRKWKCPNSPVVGVSWYEAYAFTKWLSSLNDGHEYRLPREEEWEAAAAGFEKRAYPWGNEWGENRCNSKETGIGKTSPVGVFRYGNTPTPEGTVEGIADMAGNVWEWTSSEYRSKAHLDDFVFEEEAAGLFSEEKFDELISMLQEEKRTLPVLRGGSWYDDHVDARCAFRFGGLPGSRYGDIGFRCARTKK